MTVLDALAMLDERIRTAENRIIGKACVSPDPDVRSAHAEWRTLKSVREGLLEKLKEEERGIGK